MASIVPGLLSLSPLPRVGKRGWGIIPKGGKDQVVRGGRGVGAGRARCLQYLLVYKEALRLPQM